MPGFDDLETLRDAVSFAPTRRPIHDGPEGEARFHAAALSWLRDDVGMKVEAEGERPLHLIAVGDDDGGWLSVYAVPADELRPDQAAALRSFGVGSVFRLELDGLTPDERAGALWLLVGAGYDDAVNEAERLGAGTGIDLEGLRGSFRSFAELQSGGTLQGRVVAVTTGCLTT